MATLERAAARSRPVYLNLFAIRQPLPAVVSILHRISGVLLFVFGVPLLLYGLQCALASPEGWNAARAMFAHPLVKLVTIVLAWAYIHHLLAGVRHLVMDVHIGLNLRAARQSSAAVLVLAILLTLVVAVRLW